MLDTYSTKYIRIPKTAEIVAARIRKAIIRGELKPGDKLSQEASLISEFEVSRPTIREAIRVLESEGLISVSRGARGGAEVRGFTGDMVTRAAGLALQAKSATIADIYTARTIIEPPAARMAAETRPSEAAAVLRAHHQLEIAMASDAERAHAIAVFHHLLLEQSGNVALAVVGQALHDVVARHMQLAFNRGAQPEQSAKLTAAGFRSHERLCDLIEAGDGAQAEAHWARHMKAAGVYWLASLGKTSVIDVLE